MEIKPIISVQDLSNCKNKQNLSHRMTSFLVNFLQKHFAAPILLEALPETQKIPSELYDAIETASKLQELGIIKKISKTPKYPDEPFLYRYVVASKNLANGSGSDFFNEKAAIWKSIAETTERFIWFYDDSYYKNRLIHASFNNIQQGALNIFDLAGFSKKQRGKYSELRFDEKTVLGWTPAVNILSKKRIFCPAQLVSHRYTREQVQSPFSTNTQLEPILRWCITTGLATGPTIEEAVTKGILEIIERDAYMISYLNRLSPPVMDLDYLSQQDGELEKIFKLFKRYGLEIYILKLPTDFSVNVVSSVIVDRSGLGPAFTIGNSSDFDLKSAIVDSLSESLAIRLSLKDDFEKEISANNIGRKERLLYWSKIENLPKISFLTQGKKLEVDFSEKNNLFNETKNISRKKYYKEKLEILRNELRKKKYGACYVELSDKRIRQIGFRCVQVVVPMLQPMHLDEVIPYFGGSRLKEVPLKTGFQPTETLNNEPHPFC